MTRLFMEDGKQIPVTVLQLDAFRLLHSAQSKGRLHCCSARCRHSQSQATSQAMRGHFAAAKVEPKRKSAEFRV